MTTDKHDKALVKLSSLGRASAKDLGLTSADIASLELDEYVQEDGVILTGLRGRPPRAWKLAAKGRKRAAKLS